MKNKNTILMSVYGTLRKGKSNYYHYLSDAKHIGTGLTVEKYKMTISGSIPFVSKSEPLTRIAVDLFEVDSKNLPSLDRLESHPTWYKREEIEVEVDGKIYKSWLYFNEISQGRLVESGDYNVRT